MFRISIAGARVAPIVGLAVIVFSLLAPPATVFAQAATKRPPLNLTTSPIPLSIVTQPGKTVTADLRVKNNNTDPERLKIELLKFGASGESGDPQLHEREPKDTYFDWVSFSEQTFTADPGVWKTIKMTIKTPPTAAFGYYLAVLFSRATADKPTGGGTAAVEGGVASLVLLDVEAPGAKREAKVVSLTADRKVYEFLPATLNIRLRNSGNVHVAPTGSIFIKRGGAQVAALDFNTARGNILPGTNRAFTATWSDGFPYYVTTKTGDKTKRTLRWDFSKLQKFRFGHYTATLVAVYDDGQRDIPVEATVGFWIIPWRIIGVVLLILLLAGTGIWMIFRAIYRKLRPGRGKRAKKGKTDTKDTKKTDKSDKAAPDDVATDDVTSKADPDDKPAEKTAKTETAETAVSAPHATESEERKTAPELKD